MAHPPKVLVVTGGLISSTEKSIFNALKRWISQFSNAQAAWLDFKVKLVVAESLVGLALERMCLRFRRRTVRDALHRLSASKQSETPSLTEVVMMTLLAEQNIPFEVTTLDALYRDSAKADRLLEGTDCVFLSTTYLHDLSELEPVIRRMKRTHNRIVLGGAMVGAIHDRWEGMPEIDIVAIGYGELLFQSLGEWLHSDFQVLRPPATGRIVEKKWSRFLFSGVPLTKDLDFLQRPDWSLASRIHQRPFQMIYYESVRGCPYRCSFCNYPYLFDDKKFRYKSAERMAADWEHYISTMGVEYITCLDSLFTMPRQRLHAFCKILIEREIRVKWICYARADDLADEETVVLMKAAGAHQVQIGIESGDPELLQNMNKQCSVEANRRALKNCRRHGLTTVVSLIVGFPGETEQSLARTYDFLHANPPDFYFLAIFSTRIPGVPILQPEMKRRFGLHVMDNLHSMAPYWRHDTMSCAEAGENVRKLDQRLMRNRVALNAVLFYAGMLSYHSEMRDPLLDFQQRVASKPMLRKFFDIANRWVDHRMTRDMSEVFDDPLEVADQVATSPPSL